MSWMWEVRAAPGRLDELVAWVDSQAEAGAELFQSADPDPRVVVIATDVTALSEVPPHLIARPAHAWEFSPVTRR